jgi:hypothetical protein
VGRVRPGDHLCLEFGTDCLEFGTDDEQREVLAAFMLAGLAQGEKVVYFTDGTAPEMITGVAEGPGHRRRPGAGPGTA